MLRPHRSVDQDLASHFKDPRVRLAFSFQSKYLGMSPFRCPSLFTILSFMEYEYGVYHPRGGTGAVIAAMAKVARELGATVRTSDRVDEILFEGKRAVGVRIGEVEHRYDALVVNSDFAQTMTTLVPDAKRKRWTDRKIAKKKFSCSTFMMYVGIEGSIPDLAHHTIFLSTDYRRNLAEIEAGQAPGEPSFYVQNACVTDPALAPPGHSHALRAGPGRSSRRRRRGLAGRSRRSTVRWSCSGWSGSASRTSRTASGSRRSSPRAIGRMNLSVYRGATFNLAHNIRQMLHWRPRNRFEDLNSVYLVGGGTHPGSGLPVIFESARITSRLLTEDLGIDPNWSAPSAMAADHYVPAIAEAL